MDDKTLPITVLSTQKSACTIEHRALIESILSYTEMVYKDGDTMKGEYGKVMSEVTKTIPWTSKKFVFFDTGLIERVRDKAEERGWKTIVLNAPRLMPTVLPQLPRIRFSDGREFEDFREDQKEVITAVREEQRGIVVGFTGIGKTLLQMGVMKAFPSVPILLLCHDAGIIKQTSEDMKEFGIKHGLLTGWKKSYQGERLVLATRGAAANVGKEVLGRFKGVILDEAHHFNSFSSEYARIFSHLDCPLRVAFTATLPVTQEGLMTLEAHFGPLIAEIGIREGTELGLLAHPRISIGRIPVSYDIRNLKVWDEVYKQGVIQREVANRIKAQDARKLVEAGLSVLVVVTNIEHGDILQRMVREELKAPVRFVRGQISMKDREEIKNRLKRREEPCVIANVVWREGINIPSLNAVINAAGGKSEIQGMQTVGRGLRKTEEKDEMMIRDYFDPSHRKLVEHFGERLTMYMDNEWEFFSMESFLRRNRR